MTEPVRFHTDLYRRDALELVAQKYQQSLRVELTDSGSDVLASFESLTPGANLQALCDEFCTEAFSATATRLREAGDQRASASRISSGPAWGLLKPFGEGTVLGLGWVLESVS